MSQKASAYNQYGDAAIMSLILDQMPKVCVSLSLSVISLPLSLSLTLSLSVSLSLSLSHPQIPQIAAEVASPLNKVEDIVIVSGNDGSMSSEVTKLLAELPPSVQALTGLDIKGVSKMFWICFVFFFN